MHGYVVFSFKLLAKKQTLVIDKIMSILRMNPCNAVMALSNI